MADQVAAWSKDPSTRVGCVLVLDRRILSTGYNGFPLGMPDSKELLNDRPTKYLLVQHAEANAVSFAARHGVRLEGATAYVTHPCCSQCMGLLVQAGVRKIIQRSAPMRPETWQASMEAARLIAEGAGVESMLVGEDHGESDEG